MKPRILMINYEHPPLGGGGGVAASTLASGFVQNNIEVDYITMNNGTLPDKQMVDGYTVYRVQVLRRSSQQTASNISMLSFLVSAVSKIRHLTRRYSYMGINTHFAIPTGPLGVYTQNKLKIPNILSIHGRDVYDPTWKHSPHQNKLLHAVVTKVMNSSSRVVAQSTDIASKVSQYYPLAYTPDIIPLPYLERMPSTDRKAANTVTLISIGRMVKRKGFDFLLNLLPALPPNIRLILVGDGPESSTLKQVASVSKIDDRVEFTDHVSDAQKRQLLKSADIYILPSTHEGFGIVIQEAMDASLPVIATNTGGQTDLIVPNVTGLLLPKQKKAFTDAIIKLAQNRPLRQAMGQSGKELLYQYHPKSIANKYLKLYEQLH